MKTLIMIAGAPGSGKTTLAHELMVMFPEAKHFEADHFFECDGEYTFRPELLADAHNNCLFRTGKAMENSVPVVIVANCFTRHSHRVPYLSLARRYGYVVHFIHLTNQYGSIHGVPDYAIERNIREFEPFQNF